MKSREQQLSEAFEEVASKFKEYNLGRDSEGFYTDPRTILTEAWFLLGANSERDLK